MLLIDVGNSRCKWAYVENGVWTHQGTVDNAASMTLRHDFSALPTPTRIIVSNVAGKEMAQRLRDLCSGYPATPEFVVARNNQCGVTNTYENPANLGSDRWAGLIGAWQKMRTACLVVNCGTASTIDALSDTGEFLGGLILPGVSLMQQSLLHNTAQLTGTKGKLQDFPRNTADAIYSGVVRATQGAIQQQYALLGGNGAISCVLSGGAADIIQAHLNMPVERANNLVLEGLQIIGEASA